MPKAVPASFDIASLATAYAEGLDPNDLVAAVEARIAAHNDPALFLARPTGEALAARAAALAAIPAAARAGLPLFGIPFVVKDNIDVAGLPTTAACPDFAYLPQASATVVARLEAAGAIMLGKVNLDQFATGLVGVRSPYGVPRNAFDPVLIPGGSSSGSATAVSAGIASFSLGTDTAGSGRVPAGLNNLVGLKPTPGLTSTHGVVPACRSLDCVSIFGLTVDDAWAVLSVMGGYDPADAFSRPIPIGTPGAVPARVRIGIPGTAHRHFFGDTAGEAAFAAALDGLAARGWDLIEVDFEPFLAAARLLYEGPWVAERYAAIEAFITAKPDALHPVTRAIIEPARGRSAVEAFKAAYRLADLRRQSEAVWGRVDALVMPTVTRAWTVAEVTADPIATNSALGTYTNFVNLFGLAALAVPERLRSDGRPSGLTFVAPGGRDAWLAAIGRRVEGESGLPLGATGLPRPLPASLAPMAPEGTVPVLVVGAHMSGLPLNGELVSRGGSFVAAVRTERSYRLHALAGGPPERPGLVRVGDGAGFAIPGEVWALPPEGLGSLLPLIPEPLCIGTVRLEDGSTVKGFLCEREGLEGALDISGIGGWRAHLAR
ncbi:allophanate hydrolase [Prosthecomicrobium hirschii]|uniref:Allophanate hydrolase n=1 Tax=Prosthecodimorpha hirschii TaxID=665126 RepID=A0A0N8GFM7_9HYPH|nr:allophanate hydrolase [Prosthecomicrobium hirschii]KPL54753.1 allophanate hydrolase [Prosthecomicrobium hirschii]